MAPRGHAVRDGGRDGARDDGGAGVHGYGEKRETAAESGERGERETG